MKYERIIVVAGNIKPKEYTYYPELHCIGGPYFWSEHFYYDDFADIAKFEEGVGSGNATAALVGGLAFGVTGAVVGSAMGRGGSEVYLQFRLKNTASFIGKMNKEACVKLLYYWEHRDEIVGAREKGEAFFQKNKIGCMIFLGMFLLIFLIIIVTS